ncbi:MAG: DedA family protein [Bacteroidales bacterium]|nr:DedA family protein [Bacteroidales bacterium]MDY5033526.1 DedA family protein [Prevotella sp.]
MFTEIFSFLLDQLSYLNVFLLMTIESTFIPFPSEVVLPPAAYHAHATGEQNVFLLIIVATLGADMGATINYFLAFYLGRPIVYAFANSKWGHRCLLNEEKVRRSEKFFDDHGVVATLTGRLVPVIRQLISIPAGLAKMNFLKFILYTTIGAGLWNCVLAAIGWYLQTIVPEDKLMEKVDEYSEHIKVFILAAIAVAVAYFIIRKYIVKKNGKQ